MSDTVIRAENLGKLYRIGLKENAPKTLRKKVTGLVGAPFKYLRSVLREPAPEEVIWALKDVSFEVKQGEVVGIIGRNGAGKSTLLKLLSQITEPSCGYAEIRGRVGSLLEVGTGFHPDLTGRENTYLNGTIMGMKKREIARRFDEIVAFAEVEKFIDTQVKYYSSGMYTRLAFAVAAHLEPEILIVDEVLAVGDAQFQKKCLGKIGDVSTKEGRTVLFVSHNMATTKQLCTKGLMFENGSLSSQGLIRNVIDSYEKSISSLENSSLVPGVIYENPFIPNNAKFWISKIEILDEKNQPKQIISTWDYVKFRIHYVARETVKRGSGELLVTTLDNTTLIQCSTEPDRKVPMSIHEGEHYFDCSFTSWPLAAGKYLLQAALAIPMKEWLYKTKETTPFSTQPKDVFNSGMPPISSRYIIAVPYEILPEMNGKYSSVKNNSVKS